MDVLQPLDCNAMHDPCLRPSPRSMAVMKSRRTSKRNSNGQAIKLPLNRRARTKQVNKRVTKLQRTKPAAITLPFAIEDEQEQSLASQTLHPSPICPVLCMSQTSDNTPVLVTPAKACSSVSMAQHSCCSLAFLPQTPYQTGHQQSQPETSTQPRLTSPVHSRLAGRRKFPLGKVSTEPEGSKSAATKHFLSAMPREADPLVQECMKVKVNAGWFFPCRGCMQITGHEYAHYVTMPIHASATVPAVPLCQTCSGRVTSMPTELRYQAERQLLHIHSNWSVFGQ